MPVLGRASGIRGRYIRGVFDLFSIQHFLRFAKLAPDFQTRQIQRFATGKNRTIDLWSIQKQLALERPNDYASAVGAEALEFSSVADCANPLEARVRRQTETCAATAFSNSAFTVFIASNGVETVIMYPHFPHVKDFVRMN